MEDKQFETVEEIKESITEEPKEVKCVKVATDLDFKALKHYNMFVMSAKRHAKIVTFVSSGVLIALGIFMIVSYFINKSKATDTTTTSSYMNIVLGAIAIIFGGYSLFTSLKQEDNIDKQIGKYFDTHAPFHQIVEFEGENVYVHKRNELRKEPYDWSHITEINQTPEYYFLMVDRQTPLIISRDPEMMREGTKEDLDAVMDERGAARPYKKYNKTFVKNPITYVQTFEEVEAPMEEEDPQVVATKACIKAIDSLGFDVRLEDEEAIKAAREAFDSLTEEHQLEITNYVKLQQCEKKLAALKDSEEK